MNKEDNPPRSLILKAFVRLFDIEQPQYILLLVGMMILGALGYGIFKQDGQFLYALRSTEVSRGLITFLVAVTTVSIAILVALFAISSNTPPNELKERFGLAKEVLTTLVGILGTVLGFYFGSSDRPGTQALQLAEVQFRKGQILTHVSNGTEPYRYVINYPNQSPKSNETHLSTDGWIIEPISPALHIGDIVTIEVSDSKELRLIKTAPFISSEANDSKQPQIESPDQAIKTEQTNSLETVAPTTGKTEKQKPIGSD